MNLAVDPSESLALNNRSQEIDRSPQPAIEANLGENQIDLPSLIEASSISSAIPETSDLKAELESLLMSLQLAIPQPPKSGITVEFRSLDQDATIAETPQDLQPLFQALNTTHDRIASIYAHLQVTHQQNQAQVESIDSSILEAKQLKFRTEQLARYSKNQLEKTAKMLESIEQIHTELIAGLAKFGGHAEIQTMLEQLETTRYTLQIAQESAATGQKAVYDSLREIQVDVAARSHESEQKLARYDESIQSLSATVSADRLQLATMTGDLTHRLSDLASLNSQITTTHTQNITVVETIRSRMVEIDREFSKLSASFQTETEQFYQLTVTSIEKTEAVGLQLANIHNQISENRDSISKLKIEIEATRHTVRQETEQKLNNLDLRYHQLMSNWDDFQVRQKDRTITTKKFSRWLWILSFAIGGILVMLIRILAISK
jgi:hypothetical protein